MGGPVGEPDAANPHVRFDERDLETDTGYTNIVDPVTPRQVSTLPDYKRIQFQHNGRIGEKQRCRVLLWIGRRREEAVQGAGMAGLFQA